MDNKLKILCLHGFRQTSEKFRIQTGGMRKFLKNQAEFTFVSAPHLLGGVEGEQRSWWFSKPNNFSSKDETEDDTGFEDCLNFIEETFKTNGPFDGIFGFSQGAALTAMLCSVKEKKERQIDFSFVIIVSGFKSKCSKHSKYFFDKINIPSLHVIGQNDDIIDKSVSEDLANLFVDPVISYHAGRHHVPTSSTMRDVYRDFLNKQKKLLTI